MCDHKRKKFLKIKKYENSLFHINLMIKQKILIDNNILKNFLKKVFKIQNNFLNDSLKLKLKLNSKIDCDSEKLKEQILYSR